MTENPNATMARYTPLVALRAIRPIRKPAKAASMNAAIKPKRD